jgi:hypothetical protein
MQPKSNHLAVFSLDLKSTYEGKYMIIGLLSQAMIFSSSIHLPTNDKISFFFMAK